MLPTVIPLAGRQLVCDLGVINHVIPGGLADRSWPRVRLVGLRRELRFLRRRLPGCDESLEHYVQLLPDWTEDVLDDALGFLRWYRHRHHWTPQQNDHWLCQRAICLIGQDLQRQTGRSSLFAIQRSADQGWMQWRYQDAVSHASGEGWWITVNPVRQWVALATPALLQGKARPPANVMFFPADDRVCAAVLGLEGLALVNCLIDDAPCALQEWLAGSPLASQDALWGFCRELARCGVLALTPRLIAA